MNPSEKLRPPAHTLDYWFDYSCPYAYLGSTQVEALAARCDAALAFKAMLLGGVFRAVGTPQNLLETLSPAKAAHNLRDMHRWAALYGVPFRVPPEHPRRTVEALRATLACHEDPRVIHGFFRAYWVEGRDPSSDETIRSVVSSAGYDPEATLAAARSDAVKLELRARTDEAVALGVFGAPALVLDDGPLYWGQDSFPLVERAAGVAHEEPAPRAPGASPHTLEVYWDFSSPFAYLGVTQARALAERTGATLVHRPMLLGGLFRAVGQVDVPLLAMPPAKQRYYGRSLDLWAAQHRVPFAFPSRFPMNTVQALRAYLALDEALREGFMHAAFRAYWAEDRDLADEGVLAALLRAQGADADAVLARTRDPAVKQQLIEATARAKEAGVFGAPAWVVDGGEPFWGQDRLPLVEAALRA